MINGMADDISFITLLVMLVIGFALAYIILYIKIDNDSDN